MQNILNRFTQKKKTDETDLFAAKEETDIAEAIDRDSVHSILPFSLEYMPTHVESGENFIRVLTVVDYPRKVHGNWLSELRRKKNNINIVQFIEGASSSKMIDYYKKTIANKEAEILKTHDALRLKTLQREKESADLQLEKYLNGETSFVYQYTYIYLRATSLRELDDLTENVKNTLIKLQLKALTPTKATFQSFWSSLPIAENLLKEYTYSESNTEAVSSMFPFDDAEILNLKPRSDIEGINKDTGSLIATDKLDERETLNQNELVLGTSGVGKTTYMMQKILRYFVQGYQIYIIDPENEYSTIVRFLGGSVLTLSSNAKHKINPMQIFSDCIVDGEDEEMMNPDMETLIKDKIQRMKGFLEVIKDDIRQVEKAVMDDVIKKTYVNRGILKYKSIDQIQYDQYPTLSDIDNELEKLKNIDPQNYEIVRELHVILKSYTHGSNSLFNGYTTVDMSSQIVSFNLLPLQNEKEVQGAAYLNTFQFLWDEITKDRVRIKKLFIDEFHFLTLHQLSATFAHQAFKRARKYKGGIIAGSQQVQDVLQGTTVDGLNVGEAIAGNTYTKVFFGFENKGVEDVSDKMEINFSQKEKKLLARRRQGEALMIHGSKRAFLKVELTEEEMRLINPVRYKEKYEMEHTKQPAYEDRVKFTPREVEEIRQFTV